MIRYSLHPFPLRRPDDHTTYQARVRSVGTLQTADIIDRMAARGVPGGRPAAVAAVEVFFQVCQQALLEGYNLATPVFVTELSIRGKFDGPDDRFRPNRHQLAFKASAGPVLQDLLRHEAETHKVETRLPQARPHQCLDLSTERDDRLTPGGAARISGYDLKLGDAPDEYLAFELPDGTEVRVTRLLTNKPSELLFLIPEEGLPTGQSVQLIIHRRPHNATAVRTSRFGQPLLVQ